MPHSNKRYLISSGNLSALILGYALLIAYGSLYPFHNWRTPVAGLWDFLFLNLKGPYSISDIDLNILAYMPLGLLLALRLQRKTGIFLTLLSAALLGAALSLSMELLQNYLPERVPSRIDLATNTLGAWLGALGILLLGSNMPLGKALKRRREALLLPGMLADIGLIVLAGGMFILLPPLAPSLEPGLRNGSIFLLWQAPFGSFHAEPLAVAQYAGKVIALGLLFAAMSLDGRIRLRPYLALFALVMLLKFVSTVLLFRVPPLQWLLSFKALLGLGIGIALLPWLQRLPRAAKAWASACIILGLTIFDALQAGQAGAASGRFNWIPFAAQMNGIQGLLDVLATAMPFLVAGCAINLVTPYMRRSLMLSAGLVVVLVATGGVEWLQRDLPGRTADITDILLAAMGWVATWFWMAHIPPQNARNAPSPAHREARLARPRSKLYWSVLTLATLGMLWGGYVLLSRPIELPLASMQMPPMPEPTALPAINLTKFKQGHPRLPAPTRSDSERLQHEGREFLGLQDALAKRGDMNAAIMLARLYPGSQNLEVLHRQLLALKFNDRGDDQAQPLALAYDWLYDQWTPSQRTQLQSKLTDGCDYIIEVIRKGRLSPYNVYLYNKSLQSLMALSLALYGDHPQGELALRFTQELWKNRTLPVWRQIMGKNGGWHEGGEYIALGIGQAVYRLPAMWRSATGEDLIKSEPGIRGFLDFMLYRQRPDGSHYRIGDASFHERLPADLTPLAIELRDAAAYSIRPREPRLAPSAWPWGPLTDHTLYDPNAVKSRPLAKLMDGVGIFVARSSWEADATYITFKAGDNFWSHSHLDQGSFTIFKGGPLAIDSGLYGSDYGADHHMNYTYQTIAHNAITVTDPDDTLSVRTKRGERFIANDGGQRRIGSGWGIEPAPMDHAEWQRKRAIYHTGKIQTLWEQNGISVLAADITPAYTNAYSGKETFSHRTNRVKRLWRTFGYDRIDDAVVIFDQVTATKAEFPKRWLLHSIERPDITAGKFFISYPRNEQLNRRRGLLTGYVLLPEQANINAIGGRGSEFLIDGKNHDEGGKIQDIARKRKDPDVGAWRIEVTPSSANREDQFLTVLLPATGNTPPPHKVRLLREGKRVGCEIIGPRRTTRWWFTPGEQAFSVEIP